MNIRSGARQGRQLRWAAGVAVMAAVAVVFLGWGVLNVTFLGDDVVLLEWGDVALSGGFWRVWAGAGMVAGAESPPYYRPLTLVSHGLDLRLWGWSPAGHRAANLILHFANVLLVFGIGRRLLGRQGVWPSGTAALLFALHPVHEAAVWWVACRMELLCAFFYLLGVVLFLWYLADGKRLVLVAAVLSGALALAAKEMAYTLPIAYFLLAVWVPGHSTNPPATWKPRFMHALAVAAPMAVVAGGFLLLRLIRMPVGSTLFAFDASPAHILMVLRLAARYLVFPFGVSLRALAAAQPVALAGGVAVAAALAWMLRRRLGSWPVVVGVAWICVTMLPLARTMSPWTLYIPSVGFCLAAGYVMAPARSRRGAVAAVCLALLAGAYVVQLQARKEVWRETDRIVSGFFEDLRRFADETPDFRPVFATAPGQVGHVPALLHFLEERARLETGRPKLETVALAYLMLPADPDEHGVELERTGAHRWAIVPESPATLFGFPDAIYRFQHYPAGTRVDREWGAVILDTANTSDVLTRVTVELSAEAFDDLAGRDWLVYADGRLMAMPEGLRP